MTDRAPSAVVGIVAAALFWCLCGPGASRAGAATYTEDPSDLRNPERGFYRSGYVDLLSTSYGSNAAKFVTMRCRSTGRARA